MCEADGYSWKKLKSGTPRRRVVAPCNSFCTEPPLCAIQSALLYPCTSAMDTFTLFDYDSLYGALAWKVTKAAKDAPAAPLGDLAFFLVDSVPATAAEYAKRIQNRTYGFLVMAARWDYEGEEEAGAKPDYYTLHDPVAEKDYTGFAEWYSERGGIILQLEDGDVLPAIEDQLRCGPKYSCILQSSVKAAEAQGAFLKGADVLAFCGLARMSGKHVLAAPSPYSTELIYPVEPCPMDDAEDEEGAAEEAGKE